MGGQEGGPIVVELSSSRGRVARARYGVCPWPQGMEETMKHFREQMGNAITVQGRGEVQSKSRDASTTLFRPIIPLVAKSSSATDQTSDIYIFLLLVRNFKDKLTG